MNSQLIGLSVVYKYAGFFSYRFVGAAVFDFKYRQKKDNLKEVVLLVAERGLEPLTFGL